ncbi:hypothetical protein HZC21_05365 [Candidatus Peregrinibacteria bacterium]|nr:hypothetical protein [Candidatus Peregrinibacteria bacterium]
MKLKILLIGLGTFLLFFLVMMTLGNTTALEGKMKEFKACDDGNKCTFSDAIQPNGVCMGRI